MSERASMLHSALVAAAATRAVSITGRVEAVRALRVLVRELPAPVGALVTIYASDGDAVVGEIVGFEGTLASVMLYAEGGGISPGDRVRVDSVRQRAWAGHGLLGRVLNGLGQPIDGRGTPASVEPQDLHAAPVGAMRRPPIREPLRTGVRAVDLFTPLGAGQRMGIFAGAGVGKSTLLGMIAKSTNADVNVIALIGERGREVRDFIDSSLGATGLERSVVVVATGDESPLLRIRAARYACSIAEWFRDRGQRVMLMMDSITRFAHAQRQVGLSVGEPPATKGYTPSVFSAMGTLLERAGTIDAGTPMVGGMPSTATGSITGLYTILVDGDDMTDPIADAARGILDGHIILSRKLAQRGHFPSIDVLDSVSRVADAVIDEGHAEARRHVLRLLARYREIEDLIQIGAYASGSDPVADTAIAARDQIDALLQQGVAERAEFAQIKSALLGMAIKTGDELMQRMTARGSSRPAA